MICPHCWQSIIESDFSNPKSSKLLCPSCELDLPENYLSASQHIISIVAANASGKSYFLSVHLKEMRDSLYYKYGCFLRRSNENTTHIESMIESVYGSEYPLPKISLGGPNYQNINNKLYYPKPFIYTLSRPGISQEHNLVYYHQAGEAYEPGIQDIAIESPLASGIIFLFDPFKDLEFKREMAKYSDASDPQYEIPGFDQRISNVLDQLNRGLLNAPRTSSKKVPIAFVVGKYDAWHGLARSYFATPNYFTDPRGDEGLDDAAIEKNSQKLRGLLLSISPGVCAQVDSLPGSVTYFPVSSFGKPATRRTWPDGMSLFQHPVPVKPFLVDVPMLWLIHKFAPELVSV